MDMSEPEYFATVECGEKGASTVVRANRLEASNTRFTEPVCLRYVIDLYRVTSSHSVFVERKILFADVNDPNPQAIATFDVEAQHYHVLVWCDYVQDDVREAWYYNTDNLLSIRYSDTPVEDNNDKDVFTNMLDADLSDYYYAEGEHELIYGLELQRPKGRFRCITIDMEDYMISGGDINNILAQVTYTQYVSAGYNVEEQKPNYFEPTRTFVTRAQVNDLGQLELCYDYVFVNGKQTNVKIDFYFYDSVISEETEISHWTAITVPLRRNMETIVEGRMLTTSFGTGGIGIDPGFENEIVIPWE